MKIKFLIQSNNINLNELNNKVNALKNISAEYADFGLIPFSSEIVNLENILEYGYKYVILGGIKVINLITSAKHISELNPNLSQEQIELSDYYLNKLKDALFYDFKKFDQKFYSKLNLPLFNDKSLILNFKDAQNKSFDSPMFVKPTSDLKFFNGGFIDKGENFKDFIKRNQLMSDIDYNNTDVLFAPIKNNKEEYRFFIINKNVISGSRYMVNGKSSVSKNIPDIIFKKAQEYALLYQPSEIFTLDLVLTDNDVVEIMEYNCFNCSGSYMADLEIVYSEIISFLNKN